MHRRSGIGQDWLLVNQETEKPETNETGSVVKEEVHSACTQIIVHARFRVNVTGAASCYFVSRSCLR